MSHAPTPPRPPGQRPLVMQVLGIATVAVVAMTASAALAWSLRSWQASSESSADVSPAPSTPAVESVTTDRPAVLAGAGRLAYQVHCARCHGANGHGDGPDAERLQPPPRDFAGDRWRTARTPDSVRRTIVAGIAGTAMPGWGESLSRRELDGLVAHVLALSTVPAPRPEVEAAGTDEPLPSESASLLARAGFVAEATPRPAPPLALRDLDGNATTLDDRRGRPVLVLFWGTTCAHCLDEIPAVMRFADRHRDRGLDVLPVCVDEPDASVIRNVAGPELSRRPLYLDPGGTARLRYDVQAMPSVALIDRSGRLVARAQGARDWTDPALDDLVRQGFVAATKSE